MIHLCYSNRTEALLDALVEHLRRERAGPFEPVRLVVPNRNVETYLKLRLAERLGIAANLEVTFLRGLLAGVAKRALPGARVVDARQLEGYLLVLLHDAVFLADPALGPVRTYLEAAGGAPAAVDRRRCQLAAELAQLFDEYAGSRPELLAAWRERASFGGREELRAVEEWQRVLWLAVFGRDGAVVRRSRAEGVTWMALADLLAATDAQGAAALGPTLHLFGISYVARGYHRMLAAVARSIDVRVYTLNPCREFWEDLETTAEARRRLKREGREALFPKRQEARQPQIALGDDPYGLQGEGENLPLRLWGRPGRENVRLLNQLADGDFEARFGSQRDGGGATTLLGRLQDDILDRATPAAPDGTADDSLRVLSCPGLRRELEVIAAEIWRLCDADPTLRFNEIALVVPEPKRDLYLSHVGAVFGEAHELPHSVIDLPLAGGHSLGEAVELLLELPLGSFSRRELLPLLTHPAIMARFPEATAGDWLRLVDELGIVHGADRRDHAGTYIERDLVNWDQGVRRLVLGAFMSGEGAPVAVGDQQYLPVERPGDEESSALGFALLVRSLIEDARFLGGVSGPAARPLAQWLELIRGLLTGYLVPPDAAAETMLSRCLAELAALEELPLGATPVSYRVAATLVRSSLAGIGGTRGQYLASGVTVSSFVPMRAIPFRVVFVAGLGQGDFPSANRQVELDLRAAKRYPGDVSAREQDLYMFLETLLCARERLVLSYVGRDDVTGEPLAASSVLLELREILARYLPPAELGKLFDPARPALRRYDDEARLAALPLARREHAAKALGQSLRAALPAGAAGPDLPALRRALDPTTFGALAERLGVHAPPARAKAPGRKLERVVVPLASIRQFLEDPLQGSARFRLRMREIEGDEELVDRVDEPFETDRLTRTILLKEVMLRAMAAGEPSWERLRETFAAQALTEELAGRLPTGFLGEAERPAHEAVLRGWWEDVMTVGAGRSLAGRVLQFGRTPSREGIIGESREPIVLEVEAPNGGTLQAELVGRTELLVGPEADSATLLFILRKQSSDKSKFRERDWLRAFIDHLALAAAGGTAGARQVMAAVADAREHALDRARFLPVTTETARLYLAEIVREMLTGARDASGAATGVHPYLLPCEAVFAVEGKGAVADEVEKLRDTYFQKDWLTFSSVNGPVPEAVEHHEPPPPAEAAAMMEARFGLFYELLDAGEKPKKGGRR